MDTFEFIYPEQHHEFFRAAFPWVGLLSCSLLARFLSNHWHIDAERSAVLLFTARRSVIRMLVVGFGMFILQHLTDVSGLFGLFSILTLRFDLSHSIALACAVLSLILFLHAYADPLTPVLVLASLAGIAITFWFQLPYSAGFIWTATYLSWMPLLLLFKFELFRPDPGVSPSEWIKHSFRRGAREAAMREVVSELLRQAQVSPEPVVLIGNQLIHRGALRSHVMLPGASGTGKTILLRLMMQSVFQRFRQGLAERAIVFDAKHEQVSVIAGMSPDVPVLILNPFDARTCVWDLADDFRTPSDALQLAKLFLPDSQSESDAFWSKSARGLLADIIRAHCLAFREGRLPHWSLSDLMRSLQSKKDIEEALALSDSTKDALRNIHEDKIYHGVLATLDLVRREFEPLAALWDEPSEDPSRLFSLNQWIQGSGVLILGPSAVAEEVINPLNRLILDRLGQLILDMPDNVQAADAEKSTTWLFLDEFPRLGRMPRIENLLTNGRSKGLIAVLAFQDISELKDNKLYGESFAQVIAGACTQRVFFQASSHAHALWCSESLGSGEVETLSKSFGETLGGGGASTTLTWSASEKTRPLLTKDEFLYLGRPGIRTALRPFPSWLRHIGWMPGANLILRFFETSLFSPVRTVCNLQGRVFRMDLPFIQTVEAMLPKAGEDYIPRPDAHQFLKTWREVKPNPSLAPPLAQPQVVAGAEVSPLKESIIDLFKRNTSPVPPP